MLTNNLILMTFDDFSMSDKLLIKILLITQVTYQIRINTKTLKPIQFHYTYILYICI